RCVRGEGVADESEDLRAPRLARLPGLPGLHPRVGFSKHPVRLLRTGPPVRRPGADATGWEGRARLGLARSYAAAPYSPQRFRCRIRGFVADRGFGRQAACAPAPCGSLMQKAVTERAGTPGPTGGPGAPPA